ncbi:MAG: YjzC family protein [Chloroflexi bacterium]|nr:YjzC family protein [Chloroflexota bacterium]
MNGTFNPEMLTLAREIRGMTQTQLARDSGIGQTKISRYEGDLAKVDAEDLRDIANTLEFPEAFFYQSGQRFGAESTEVFHRRRSTVSARDLRRIDGLVNLYRIGSERLLQSFQQVGALTVPSLSTNEFSTIPEIAYAVRSFWNLPSGRVTNLIALLEKASCLVFSFDFKIDKIDEVVQWIPPSPPIILVNSTAPADRVRMSLAHALGHLVMHRNVLPYKEMEREANEFAAAFLMPEDDIIDELKPVTIQHMLELKQYWKVSMQSLIYRAKELEVISERRFKSLFQQLSRFGYRKQEPFPISPEKTRLVDDLVNKHRLELGYSDEELAQLLRIRVEDFNAWYRMDHKILDLQETKMAKRQKPGTKPRKPGEYIERGPRGGKVPRPRIVTIEPGDSPLPPTQKPGRTWERKGPPKP